MVWAIALVASSLSMPKLASSFSTNQGNARLVICSVQPWGYSFKYADKPWARPSGVVETMACRSANFWNIG